MLGYTDFVRRPLSDDVFAQQVADTLRVLAHPGRVRILALLSQKEHSVTELIEILGARPSFVSQQLRILRLSELVTTHREGAYSQYQLARPDIGELLDCLERCPFFHAPDWNADS